MNYQMSTRRKLAIATWASPREGNIYGRLTLDMTKAVPYLQHLREKSDEKVTVTHLVGKAIGEALKAAPDINGRIFLGRYIPHKTVDLAFLVTMNDGDDLAKFKVRDVDKKSYVEIARELREGSQRLREGKDSEFEKSKPILKMLPTWLIRPMLWATGYISGAAGISVKALGLDAFPFGAAIVTSVGMLGIDEGYAPPTPFARVPVYIAVMKIKDRVVAHNGQVVIRPELDLMATIDHRFMDGYQGSIMIKILRKCIEEPWILDGHTSWPVQT
jgi:pyruvate dehydrogenase E2 component (dihydrolipoamide acetyltransferase)